MKWTRVRYLILIKGHGKERRNYFFGYNNTPASRKKLVFKLMDIAQEPEPGPSDLTMREVARLIFMIKRHIKKDSRYLIRYFHPTPVKEV